MDLKIPPKILSILPYIEKESIDQETLVEQSKLQILERTFEIMLEGCRLNAADSLFYRKISDYGDKHIFFVNIAKHYDPRYKDNGSVNGNVLYFTIDDKNIKGNIYLGNENGMPRYSSFGMQQNKENHNTTNYYHILDGSIVSEVTCKKEATFLEEISSVEAIKPFAPRLLKNYKNIKKGNH